MPDKNCPICGCDIAATGASADDEAPIETALTLAENLTRLLGRYLGDHTRPETARSEREPIRHIKRWIQERLREDLSVARLASEAGMSQRNFARAFVQEMRMTPAEYVRICRLSAAERLLEVTALPVQLIAFESGFSNQALRRACLLRHGLTPSEYRAKVKPRVNRDKP